MRKKKAVCKFGVRYFCPKDEWRCECGYSYAFDIYALAHWRDELVHVCSKCGRRHSLKAGMLKLIRSKHA